jgi:hypothetical protein
MKILFTAVVFLICINWATAEKYNDRGYWEPWTFVDMKVEHILDVDIFSDNIIGYTARQEYTSTLPPPMDKMELTKVMLSYDGGKTFKQIFVSLGDTSIANGYNPLYCAQLTIADSLNIFVRLYNITSDTIPHLFARTTDGGNTWSIGPWINQYQTAINTVRGLKMQTPEYGIGWNVLYVNFIEDSSKKITTSNDLGYHLYENGFELNNVQLINMNNCYALAVNYNSHKANLYISDNKGIDWLCRAVPDSITSMYFVNDSVGWFTVANFSVSDTFRTERIYKTIDTGRTFTLQLEKKESYNCLSNIFFANESEGVVIGSIHVYHTFDGGEHWLTDSIANGIIFGAPNIERMPHVRARVDNMLFKVSGNNAIWRYKEYPLSVSDFQVPYINSAIAYPNPFSDKVRIEFEMVAAGEATVTLYNSLGEEEQKITKFFQSGKSYFDVSPVGHETGVYFYEIKSRENCLRGKVVLSD